MDQPWATPASSPAERGRVEYDGDVAVGTGLDDEHGVGRAGREGGVGGVGEGERAPCEAGRGGEGGDLGDGIAGGVGGVNSGGQGVALGVVGADVDAAEV